MFLKEPLPLPMWAEPGGVWEPSALGCRPRRGQQVHAGPVGSWLLVRSILGECTLEALMLGSRLPCLERKRESDGSVLAQQPRAQPPGGGKRCVL